MKKQQLCFTMSFATIDYQNFCNFYFEIIKSNYTPIRRAHYLCISSIADNSFNISIYLQEEVREPGFPYMAIIFCNWQHL